MSQNENTLTVGKVRSGIMPSGLKDRTKAKYMQICKSDVPDELAISVACKWVGCGDVAKSAMRALMANGVTINHGILSKCKNETCDGAVNTLQQAKVVARMADRLIAKKKKEDEFNDIINNMGNKAA